MAEDFVTGSSRAVRKGHQREEESLISSVLRNPIRIRMHSTLWRLWVLLAKVVETGGFCRSCLGSETERRICEEEPAKVDHATPVGRLGVKLLETHFSHA